MHNTVSITKNIHWIGVNDRRTHLFENLWPLDKGVSYNSYLINDEKTAVVDTVEIGKLDDFIDNIKSIIGDKPVDYLIINHIEPDHSGAVKRFLSEYPKATVVGNRMMFKFFEAFFGDANQKQMVKEGDTLPLGEHELTFFSTPMLHWPETMMTYEKTEKVLFSADVFGSFGTLDGVVFDDETNIERFEDEMRRYYSNIVGKYTAQTQKALKKLAGVEAKIIAPTHGLVWRKHIETLLSLYDKWSKFETGKGVVIAYASMYGNTQRMADFIARKLVENGINDIRIYDVSKTHVSYILSDIWKYKGVILGAPAYDQSNYPNMEHLLNELEIKQAKHHIAGVFGSFLWSGGAVKRITGFVENAEWELVSDSAEIKGSATGTDVEKLENLAVKMSEKLKKYFD